MLAAAQRRASVTLSAKSRKNWAERRSVLMWKRARRLSAYSQTSLCTSASAHSPISTTKQPLKNSNMATARSTRRWARCGAGVVPGWRMDAGDDSRAEYHAWKGNCRGSREKGSSDFLQRVFRLFKPDGSWEDNAGISHRSPRKILLSA